MPVSRLRASGRLTLLFAVALLVALPVVAYAGHNSATARSHLHPHNASGINATIDWELAGVDSLTIATDGTARGLDPANQIDFNTFSQGYVSLVYDSGSVPGGPNLGPGGPLTGICEPTVELELMFVGFWVVNADGTGSLVPLDPNPAFGEFDTVSIRDLRIDGGMGTDAVVACGQVAVHPGN